MLRSRRVNDDLRLALELADLSDAITMRHFRTVFAVRTKADRTPVSEVDEAVEFGPGHAAKLPRRCRKHFLHAVPRPFACRCASNMPREGAGHI